MHLQDDYPFIPIPHIRRILLNSNRLYVPTFYQLRADCAADHPPFKRKAQASHLMKHKGAELYDEAFETEKIWLTRRLREFSLRSRNK
jgi:E3 ubiquitin-protein ligase RNF216